MRSHRTYLFFRFIQAQNLAVSFVLCRIMRGRECALFPREHIHEPQNNARRPISTQIANSVQQCHIRAAHSWIADFREKRHHCDKHGVDTDLIERIVDHKDGIQVDRHAPI